MVGVVTRNELRILLEKIQLAGSDEKQFSIASIITKPVVAYPDEPLRAAIYRMAESAYTRLPVVDRHDKQKLLGMVSLNEVLKARSRNLADERKRERVLKLHLLFSSRREPPAPPVPPSKEEDERAGYPQEIPLQ